MIAFAFYLLKVIICSGILFLYYHLALRNKLFHQWNRFYLLAAVVISLVVPAAEITISHLNSDGTPKAIQLLHVLGSADGYLEEITITSNQSMSAEQWGMMIYMLISIILLISILLSLVKIIFIIRSHTFQWIGKIKFTNTRIKGTPFSFFHFIFWNREIDLQTETGQQIFQHELVHVKEKHTFDKLFVQMILVGFWCNPFFWLIRRELKLIHEFIADKKAVGEYGTAAFAAMILSASYPSQFNSMTNQFFQTSIKRRLAMLTKTQTARINYLSRLLALVIIIITAAAFTIKTKQAEKETARKDINMLMQFNTGGNDTIPGKDGRNEVAADKSLIVRSDSKVKPLYILDGKEITEVEMKKIPAESITSVNVLKDKAASDKYGSRGANGVVEITSKVSGNDNALSLRFPEPKPLIIVDGKEVSEAEFKKISPESIESINVLKEKSAVDKYGSKGTSGVIEIRLKKTAKAADEITFTYEHTIRDTIPDKTVVHEPIFSKAEVAASIDQKDWIEFLQKNLQPVVEKLEKTAPAGKYTVNVKFIVKKDGSLTDFVVLNDPGFKMGKEIIEVMKKSPKWKPAIQNNRPVSSYHTQPITLVITNGKKREVTTSNIPVINLSELEKMTGLNIPNLKSFTIVGELKNGDLYSHQNKGGNFDTKAKTIWANLKIGSILTFEKIIVIENDQEVKKPALIYRITS